MAIRWMDLHKYSLVWVEFGSPKDKIDCNSEDCPQGASKDQSPAQIWVKIIA